jgi:hypothetical protein
MSNEIELIKSSGGVEYNFLSLLLEIKTQTVITVNREHGLDMLEIEFFNGHGEPRLKMPYKLFKQYLLKIDEHFDNVAAFENKSTE